MHSRVPVLPSQRTGECQETHHPVPGCSILPLSCTHSFSSHTSWNTTRPTRYTNAFRQSSSCLPNHPPPKGAPPLPHLRKKGTLKTSCYLHYLTDSFASSSRSGEKTPDLKPYFDSDPEDDKTPTKRKSCKCTP